MSRSTAAFDNSVTASTVRPIILTEMFFDTETLRFWNGVGEIYFNGETYTGSCNLLTISQIQETKSIKATGTKFTLSGIPSSLISTALNEEYQGRKVKIYFGTMDGSGGIIADPATIFSGKADVMIVEEGAETATIELSVESDARALKRVNERRYTDEDQKSKYPGDDGLEKVTSLQDKPIVWNEGD